VYPQNIVLLQKQGGDVRMRATRARIYSGLGNSAAFGGKKNSEAEWHVPLVLISIVSDRYWLQMT
jgi:hypothetical protein